MKASIYRILDLIEQVKKVDEVIARHTSAGDTEFIISQYEYLRERFLGELLTEITAAGFQTSEAADLLQTTLAKFHRSMPVNGKHPSKELAKVYQELAA